MDRWTFGCGEARSDFGRALLRVRYRALQRHIPLLYLIALANLIGLNLSGGWDPESLLHPANLLAPVILFRLIHWVRTRHRELAPERILVELRITLVLAALLSVAASYWAGRLLIERTHEQQDLVILFASLAATGCAYSLSSFPAAARLPLLLFALPFSVVLILSPNPAHAGVGFSLALISLLILRLLTEHDRGLVEIVQSRSDTEQERERAVRAEAAALAEKARVRQIADSDALTGLANRRAFLATLEERIASDAQPLCLLIFDLDGFKPVNDTFGHPAGDALLVEVGARLADHAGPQGTAARIGGDEFAVLISIRDAEAALALAQQACADLGRGYRIERQLFRISASCGGALIERGDSVSSVLRRADDALYESKSRGRGTASLFSADLARANRRRATLEAGLSDPNVAAQMFQVFQPIVDLETGEVRAFEALARWSHPELGEVAPAEFIPLAERMGVIEPLSDALLARAIGVARRWRASIGLSVNLSTVQLCSEGAAGRILAIIRAGGIAAARLRVEITETALLADFEVARTNLAELRKAGARIVLDDFGAGFASVSYLREIRFDGIKIDGSLIVNATEVRTARQLLKGVVNLCRSLELPCVAEHIETPAQLALAQHLGCQFGQGYALSRPVDAEVTRSLFRIPIGPEGSVLRAA